MCLSVAERQKTCNDETLVAKQAGEKAKRKIETVQKLFLYQERKKNENETQYIKEKVVLTKFTQNFDKNI